MVLFLAGMVTGRGDHADDGVVPEAATEYAIKRGVDCYFLKWTGWSLTSSQESRKHRKKCRQRFKSAKHIINTAFDF